MIYSTNSGHRFETTTPTPITIFSSDDLSCAVPGTIIIDEDGLRYEVGAMELVGHPRMYRITLIPLDPPAEV